MNKELVESIGRSLMECSKQIVASDQRGGAWMVGLLQGIALVRSHPKLAKALYERFQDEDIYLAQLANMDQVIEIIKEDLP